MNIARTVSIALGTTLSALTIILPATASAAPAYPGHTPGKVCMGISSQEFATKVARLGGKVCIQRKFYQWGDWTKIESQINSDQAAGRMSWVSFKPPNDDTPVPGWKAIANGAYDAELKTLAAKLKSATSDGPAFVTFHHEPSNDAPDSDGQYWASAHNRIHDVLKAQGALANVSFAPILGDWLFNPYNSQDETKWLTAGVMQRMPFLGVDLYQNNSGKGFSTRIPAIRKYMSDRGYNKMVNIGETGCTDAVFAMSAVDCLNANLTWAKNNTDKIGAISYYDSPINSKEGLYWPLDESSAKTNTFLSYLNSATFLKVAP